MAYAQHEIPLAAFGASRWGDQPGKTIDAIRRILEQEMDGYGGVIIGESGKYLYPEPIVIDKPVTLKGQGGGSTYFEQAPGVAYAPIIFAAGARRGGLAGVHVHGNGLGPGVVVRGHDDVDLDHVDIIGAYDGLVVDGQSHRLNLSHTLIANNRRHGLFATGGYSHGIYVDVTCQVHSNGHQPKPGDDLGDNVNFSASAENIFMGNSWDAAGFIARLYAAGDNVIAVTNLNSCGRSAISLEAGSAANRIQVGMIYAPGLRNLQGEDWPAIRLVDAQDNDISAMTIQYRTAPKGTGGPVRQIGDCRNNSVGAIRERFIAA